MTGPRADDEAALVARLRRGEPAALDEAYDRHKQAIYRFLRRMTGRPELADDLFQDTWLRLARAARGLREDTRLRAWLLTVAGNLARDHARAGRHQRAGEEVLLSAPGRSPDTPFELASAGQTGRRLEAALAAMPAQQREAVLLVAIERLEPADAARVAGVTPEAFRQRLARGRAFLREALAAAPLPAAAEGGRR
ncbi:MAG TPA: sigma-70 family RNA polymerase sigma factor [Kofleriaceae bacterium]|nr:sigma-70 family RNA polymerase sigma factor [Kofleriaceae bacterium]